jgi:hypothetical protein
MHFIRFVSAKGTFSLLNETWTLDSDHGTGAAIRATIDGFVSGMVMASCLPTAAGRVRVGHHHGSYDGAQNSAEQVEEEPAPPAATVPKLYRVFQADWDRGSDSPVEVGADRVWSAGWAFPYSQAYHSRPNTSNWNDAISSLLFCLTLVLFFSWLLRKQLGRVRFGCPLFFLAPHPNG